MFSSPEPPQQTPKTTRIPQQHGTILGYVAGNPGRHLQPEGVCPTGQKYIQQSACVYTTRKPLQPQKQVWSSSRYEKAWQARPAAVVAHWAATEKQRAPSFIQIQAAYPRGVPAAGVLMSCFWLLKHKQWHALRLCPSKATLFVRTSISPSQHKRCVPEVKTEITLSPVSPERQGAKATQKRNYHQPAAPPAGRQGS